MIGQEHYQLWERFRVTSKTRKRIGKSSLRQYEVVWGKWLVHCAGLNIPWQAATSDDVQKYIYSISPRSKRGEPCTSGLTIKRYWRTLYDLYAFAVLSNIIETNPADLPKNPVTAVVLSLALSPHDWQALSDGLPGEFTPRQCRNNLILLLAMRAALTVGELISLKVGNLRPIEPRALSEAEELQPAELALYQPESQKWIDLKNYPMYSLSIESRQAIRRRVLLLDARTSWAAWEWLKYRSPTKENEFSLEQEPGYLFATGKRIKPMDAKSIYNICQAHFIDCLGRDNKIQHIGPNTLRNTCIKIWHAEGVADAEVMRRLGLKAAGALRRLEEHFTPSLTLS